MKTYLFNAVHGSRVLFSQNVPAFLVFLNFIWLALAFVPNLNKETRTLLFMFILSYLVFFSYFDVANKFRPRRHAYLLLGSVLGFYAIANLIHMVVQANPLAMFVILALGYDNGIHVGNYQGNLVGSGQTFLSGLPDGLHLTWVLLTRILFWDYETSTDVIVNFGSLAILTWLLLSVVASVFFWQVSVSKKMFIIRLMIFSALSGFGTYSFMLTSGFWPYTFGLSLLLMVVLAINRANTSAEKAFILLIGTFVTFVVCPPISLIPFSLLVGKSMILLSKSLPKYANTNRSKGGILLLSFVCLALIATASYEQFKRFGGLNQVLEPGGIEPFSVLWLLLVTLISVYYLLRVSSGHLSPYNPLTTFLIASMLISLVFVLVTVYGNGEITYYAVKQLHVTHVLLLLAILTARTSKRRYARNHKAKSGNRRNLEVIMISIVISVLSMYPAFKPKVFTGPYMGSSLNALNLIFSKSGWESQVINAPRLFDALQQMKLMDNECAVAWTSDFDGTLSGRWLAAVQPNPSFVSCFDIYYESSNQSDEQVLSEIANTDIDVLLVVLDRPLSDIQEDKLIDGGDRVLRIK